MPPKFMRIPGNTDLASSQEVERRGLLDGNSDDEDFFLRGPKVNTRSLHSDTKMNQLQGQVDDVVDIMKNNVNKVIERGDRLEDLQDKSVQPKTASYLPVREPFLTNAERCKLYRERLKVDPERSLVQRAKDEERWQKRRQRKLSEAELAVQREKSRERSKLYRERKKLEKVEKEPPPPPKEATLTRAGIASRKEVFREQKAKERAQWSKQKWCRHREACRKYYNKKKEEKLAKQSLSSHSDMFRSRAKGLHRNMWWNNCRMRIIIGLVVGVIVAIIVGALAIHFSGGSS